MKTITFLLLACCLMPQFITAQALVFLGEPLSDDEAYDVLYASDGGFIVVGKHGAQGALYKLNCAGAVTASIEKNLGAGLSFRKAVELPDGSIVAIGSASAVPTPADTLNRVVLLKTDPDLKELAFTHFKVQNKAANGKSIAWAQDGSLLTVGEVAGFSIDFTDLFFQRVDATTLQPSAAPVVYSAGVDLATHIEPANSNNSLFLISGFSLAGNIFNPEAPILNRLITMKVDMQGDTLWRYIYDNVSKAKYGFCSSGGAAINPATGNIMTSGVLYSAAPDSLTDPLFVLLDSTGKALDTAFVFIPGVQNLFNTFASPAQAGVFFAAGETRLPGAPASVYLHTPLDLNNTIVSDLYTDDTATPISLRDLAEVPVNRFAFVGTVPDNLINFEVNDVVVATPGIEDIEILYQNCALVASLSAPDPSYQWFLDGQPIPGATSGFYFPQESGTYSLQVTDAVGCSGASDTFSVILPAADFDVSAANGAYTFTNNSVGATAFLWNFGDGTTSTQENPTHTYAVSGNYQVSLIASSPCGADTTTLLFTGADQAAWLEHLRIFPNPNAGHFTVELEGEPQESLVFTLFDAAGKEIENRTVDFYTGYLQQTFYLDEHPPGLYTLQIRGRGAVQYARIARFD
jgi:hypothetical protein